MIKKTHIFGFFFLLIGAAIMFVTTTKIDNRKLEVLNNQYPFLLKEDSISGTITYVNCFKQVTLLSFSENKSVTVDYAKNYDYKNSNLCCFLDVNDSVLKRKNSDTLYVYKNKVKYFFIIGKGIGEKHDSEFYNNPCR